jgi:hypothetical protein
LDELSSKEIAFYQGLFLIDPWGVERIERSIATLTALTHNSQLSEKSRDKAVSAKEYMPYLRMREVSKENKTDSPTLGSYLRMIRKSSKLIKR